jgi:4-methylaminobutanoate oxidase (formaldehyde-forming)
LGAAGPAGAGRDLAPGWRDQHAYGWGRPPWFERVGEEFRAVRERVGLIDLSSFGKIEVDGPGATGLLQRACANDIDRAPGSVVYSQF